jgi:hypothetical protein
MLMSWPVNGSPKPTARRSGVREIIGRAPKPNIDLSTSASRHDRPNGALFTEGARESRLHRFEVEKRLVDVEDDQGKRGHVIILLIPGSEPLSLPVP